MGMDEHIECEAVTSAPLTYEKIKAFNPQIVVSDNPEKPYYNISYYDVAKKEWYIAYGSYFLRNVYKWLFECFEEVDSDMVEVVRCKDCKYGEPMIGSWDNKVWCGYHKCFYPEDGFCSYGERKDNED